MLLFPPLFPYAFHAELDLCLRGHLMGLKAIRPGSLLEVGVDQLVLGHVRHRWVWMGRWSGRYGHIRDCVSLIGQPVL